MLRAVVAAEFGGSDVLALRESPDPEPGDGQVVVDVEFCDVGTLDRLVRQGWGKEFFDVQPPYIPGDGVGGVVSALGPGVDTAWLGRRVVGGTGPRDAAGLSVAPTGGYTDTALVDVRSLVAVPDDVELDLATALLNDGVTSQLLMRVAEVRAGDSVLVLAAAGSAGMLITQLSVARDAQVVAAAHGDHKVAALQESGSVDVIDYADPNWTERVLAVFPGGPSLVFDGAGSEIGQEGCRIAAEGARVFTYGSSAGEFADMDTDRARDRGISVSGLFDLPQLSAAERGQLVQQAIAAAKDGPARPRITLLPLARADQAHSALEQRRAVGKTLLVARS